MLLAERSLASLLTAAVRSASTEEEATDGRGRCYQQSAASAAADATGCSGGCYRWQTVALEVGRRRRDEFSGDGRGSGDDLHRRLFPPFERPRWCDDWSWGIFLLCWFCGRRTMCGVQRKKKDTCQTGIRGIFAPNPGDAQHCPCRNMFFFSSPAGPACKNGNFFLTAATLFFFFFFFFEKLGQHWLESLEDVQRNHFPPRPITKPINPLPLLP